METIFVSVKKITKNKQIMPRVEIDDDYVNELIEDLELGADFSPVHLFQEGDKYILSDGYHRLEAAMKAGYENIESVVHVGDKRDALLFASGANASHGKRRTNEDKNKAVTNLLMDLEWREWSDTQIADHCKVSQPFVLKVRHKLESTYNDYKTPSRRKTKSGGTMETKNIGNKQKKSKGQKETSNVILTIQGGLPPKAPGKSKPAEEDHSGSTGNLETHPNPQSSANVLDEIHSMIEKLEKAMGDFKKSLPPKDKADSLSEMDFSSNLDRIKKLMGNFFVFCANTFGQ